MNIYCQQRDIDDLTNCRQSIVKPNHLWSFSGVNKKGYIKTTTKPKLIYLFIHVCFFLVKIQSFLKSTTEKPVVRKEHNCDNFSKSYKKKCVVQFLMQEMTFLV
jgi:hypothetical protein